MFHFGLQQLEQGAGRPSHDIRLTSAIGQQLKEKLHMLHLDRHDTTGPELYASLSQRLLQDETRFTAALQGASPESDDPIAHVAQTLQNEFATASCFALKSAAAKKLLKAHVPRRTMKALGYRSVDSMLKHESSATLYAAAWMIENEVWCKKVVAAYGKLTATDFEVRSISIEHPTAKRWQELAHTLVAQKKHYVLGFKELGTVVLLPLPAHRPKAVTLTTAVLAIHAVNDIAAASTFLKLRQLSPQFGTAVRQVVLGELALSANVLDQPISWHMAQRYYSRLPSTVRSSVFEPVVQAEDLAWHSIEEVLIRIDPAMEFWKGTTIVGMLYKGTEVVSCNLTDMLMNVSNELPYASRIVGRFQQELHSELMMKYLSHERLEDAIVGEFRLGLAPESVTI